MRFIQFERGGVRQVGVEVRDGGDIVDLRAGDSEIPSDMRSFIEGGQKNLLAAKSVIDRGGSIIPRDSVKVVAPIYNPDKVLCVGMNYIDHCEEQNAPVPIEPVIFNKFPSSIIGPTEDLVYPEETEKLDWEVELTIVIGKEAKRVQEKDAMNYVFGYTVAHDVSARDWQLDPGKNGGQWLIGKAMDGFCPLGPAIVMKEDLNDPHNLGLRCKVNGVTKQDSNTNQLVHKTAAMVTFISRFMTLKPGDLVLTGTPPGVGVFRKPPEYLKRGDVVECEIDGIGKVVNKVV
ncbi:fumarylacetoacetate hydrolase domain-containing protein 2-like [Saccostrea echinata]|uniref:fumarylacetoacetate hydrolase domain-containing protein 2-like n=1 Tax=Saccostrea echinata TaxID=191078 RepID=UPI002A82C557|nr:fumarylacetoacetate hydrolase domain-containing protein 2-like [Saccostrea echinata]XP_061171457.1 fumarylacetoacetate hydrolase domain-containing protein 2-like [Saccostrea echinata]